MGIIENGGNTPPLDPPADNGTGMFIREVSIPLKVDLDNGVYVATSPLVKGLLVVSQDRSQIYGLVYEAMKDLTAGALHNHEQQTR